MKIEATGDLWWKHAVIYCLDVETFLDSDGDGWGDFDGLLRAIDYLDGLGVTCLWLMPFYPSPNRDDGYDITDFYTVDDRLGTPGELVEALRTARDRGIRVIVDLVVNHTSEEHPWFQAARSDPDSPYRDYYVWADEPDDEAFEMVIFPNEEESNWEWDDEAGQYYLHRFFSHQPDLNIANPQVREEIAEIVGWWVQLGVSGFRIDAVPYLLETTGIDHEMKTEPHGFVRDLRRFIARRGEATVLLGEVNRPIDEQCDYFGSDGDELHMVFSFNVNQAMWLSLARQDARPLRQTLDELPEIHPDCQWANFVRIHDEANVGRLTEEERQEVYAAFAPDDDMRIFDRGIRRRLAPMLGGDGDRIRMVYSLVLSLPGTPVLYYGEELGMGENLELEGRQAVRSVMQWTDDPDNAGFSEPGVTDIRRPPPSSEYGPGNVNAAAARRDPDSLLSWMQQAIRRRRESPHIGFGDWSTLDAGHDAVLAHRCDWHGNTIVAVHSFTDEPLEVKVGIDGAGEWDGVECVLSAEGVEPELDGEVLSARLPRYGWCWVRSRHPDRRSFP